MTGSRVDELGKSIDIGAQKFLQSSVVQYFIDDRTLAAQLLQYLFAGYILSRLCLLRLFHNLHLSEENFSYLSGRRDVERFACQLIDMMFDFCKTIGKIIGSLLQCICINAHTVHLHVGKHRNQWHLYIPEQILAFYLLELGFEHIFQSQCDVGILGCILVNFRWSKVAHRLLVLALRTYQLLDVNRLVVEEDFGEIVHVVIELWLDDVVGEHRIKHLSLYLHTIVHQHLVIVLDVLSHFQDFRVLVEWFEYIYDF